MPRKKSKPVTLDVDARSLRRQNGRMVRLLKSMSNRYRLQVLVALSDGELSVTELNRKVRLSQSALSQHLAVLRGEKLVVTRREGQTIYYSLADSPALPVLKLLNDLFSSS